ncbi:MAG: class B sortase, partial [Lachnospiraceae bacterium]|nr:class B sortase [Lachnospiraceae bacterium]
DGSAQPGTAPDGSAQQSGIVTGESEQPGTADAANAAAAGSTRLNTFRAPQQPDLDDAKAPLDVNWAELKQVNPDIVGWLYLEGEPSISYPICLAEDNDYYLHRTFERKDLFAGAIFEDYHNAGDFSDPNSIVYGHNMKNGSMFGKLKYLTDSYDEHPYFWILTPYANYRYRIYSIMTTSVTSDVYMLYSVHDERYLAWEEALRSQSEVKSDVRLFKEDKTVTLSTCTSDSDYRKVVIGKCVSLQRPVKREIVDPRAALYAESSLPDEEDYVDDDEDLDY